MQDAISIYYPDEIVATSDANGKVQLGGQVNTLYDKLRIFDIVSGVKGVRAIENRIDVNTPLVPDGIIEQNIREEMKYVHSILEPDRIKVHVDNGTVFLTGDVSYYREKLTAETIASWQKGAKGIINNLEVLPPKNAVSDQNLEALLGEIMKNRFPLDTDASFTVQNGAVTLNGKVVSFWDENQIVKEFSRVRGVTKVNNNLAVEETDE